MRYTYHHNTLTHHHPLHPPGSNVSSTGWADWLVSWDEVDYDMDEHVGRAGLKGGRISPQFFTVTQSKDMDTFACVMVAKYSGIIKSLLEYNTLLPLLKD